MLGKSFGFLSLDLFDSLQLVYRPVESGSSLLSLNFKLAYGSGAFTERINWVNGRGLTEALVLDKRRELIETVSEVDDQLAEAFCSGMSISSADLEARDVQLSRTPSCKEKALHSDSLDCKLPK